MIWQDFKQIDICKYGGIGLLNHQCVCTRKIQSGMMYLIRNSINTIEIIKELIS